MFLKFLFREWLLQFMFIFFEVWFLAGGTIVFQEVLFYICIDFYHISIPFLFQKSITYMFCCSPFYRSFCMFKKTKHQHYFVSHKNSYLSDLLFAKHMYYMHFCQKNSLLFIRFLFFPVNITSEMCRKSQFNPRGNTCCSLYTWPVVYMYMYTIALYMPCKVHRPAVYNWKWIQSISRKLFLKT